VEGHAVLRAPAKLKCLKKMPPAAKSPESCLFCKIIRGDVSAHKVFEDEHTLAFLDHRPLFPGHILLVPQAHLETLSDLPASLIEPFFSNVQLLATAVERGMNAEGTFVAANNRISQSVPHFHVHVVPRRKGDGLKGFFWPRSKYKTTEEINETLAALQRAIAELKSNQQT
jgi:histidine triad (HIT) family protein